jgi:hypothetical protein
VEFGVPLKLSAVYDRLLRLGLSCLKPRARYRKNRPSAWLGPAPENGSTDNGNSLTVQAIMIVA